MLKILYICTHNRCRSILSEAITNTKGGDKLIAKSAGSEPAGEVHPLTLKYLAEAGYSTEHLASKSWDDPSIFSDFEPDLLVTVCDNAQGETCPIWIGATPKVHWGLADPSKIANESADEDEARQAFMVTIAEIEQRVEGMLKIAELPISEKLQAIKQMTNK